MNQRVVHQGCSRMAGLSCIWALHGRIATEAYFRELYRRLPQRKSQRTASCKGFESKDHSLRRTNNCKHRYLREPMYCPFECMYCTFVPSRWSGICPTPGGWEQDTCCTRPHSFLFPDLPFEFGAKNWGRTTMRKHMWAPNAQYINSLRCMCMD